MARTNTKPPAAAASVPELPARVRMLRPFGFYDEQGRHRVWHAAMVVTNTEDIALLTERGAAFAIEG